jgi:DNA-binding transcriptional regulator YiaG
MPPNLATALKDEIVRLARKEVRAHAAPLKRQLSRSKVENSALKRQIEALQKQVRQLDKRVGTKPPADEILESQEPERSIRFSSERLRRQRERLGMSAAAFAKLLGVSAQSIYLWEHGRSRPRATQLRTIASVRGLSKREAQERIART